MYEESLGLSKADRLWRDALETAAASKDISVAEELAGYFVSIGNKDAFAAVLYVCYELIRPDFVEEMVSRPCSKSLSRNQSSIIRSILEDCADIPVMAIRLVRLCQTLLPPTTTRSIDQSRCAGKADQGVVGEDEKGGLGARGHLFGIDGWSWRKVDDWRTRVSRRFCRCLSPV